MPCRYYKANPAERETQATNDGHNLQPRHSCAVAAKDDALEFV